MPEARRKHSDVINALNSNKSDRQIAKDFNVHHGTIWSWRKKYGIPKKIIYVEEGNAHREILIEMLKNADVGVSMAQMVAKLEIDRRRIYWILRKLYNKGDVGFHGKVSNYKWYWLGKK